MIYSSVRTSSTVRGSLRQATTSSSNRHPNSSSPGPTPKRLGIQQETGGTQFVSGVTRGRALPTPRCSTPLLLSRRFLGGTAAGRLTSPPAFATRAGAAGGHRSRWLSVSASLSGRDGPKLQSGKDRQGSAVGSGQGPASPAASQRRGRWRTPVAPTDYAESTRIYRAGLRHVHLKRYPSARRIFLACASKHPTFERAWVTLAQMEKKVGCRRTAELVLKSGLEYNPRSAAILQAWGLHLLQEGDERCDLMAYGLLRAAADNDPSNKNVLKWKRVRIIGQQWRSIRHKSRKAQHRMQKLRALEQESRDHFRPPSTPEDE